MDAFFFSDTYLLRGASIGDIDAIQSLSEVCEFEGGQTIVGASDASQDIMIIAEGKAKVESRDGTPIGELRSGAMIGEIAFLDGKGRTANVSAIGHCRVLVIPADRLRDLMKKNPALEVVILRNAALALCQKVREANQSVEAPLVAQ